MREETHSKACISRNARQNAPARKRLWNMPTYAQEHPYAVLTSQKLFGFASACLSACVVVHEAWAAGVGSYGTSGLVAMTSASHAEGRQFDPGLVYFFCWLARGLRCADTFQCSKGERSLSYTARISMFSQIVTSLLMSCASVSSSLSKDWVAIFLCRRQAQTGPPPPGSEGYLM